MRDWAASVRRFSGESRKAGKREGDLSRIVGRGPSILSDERVFQADAHVNSGPQSSLDDRPVSSGVSMPKARPPEAGDARVDRPGEVNRRLVVVLEDDFDEHAVNRPCPGRREERIRILEREDAGLNPNPALQQCGTEFDRAPFGQVERHDIRRVLPGAYGGDPVLGSTEIDVLLRSAGDLRSGTVWRIAATTASCVSAASDSTPSAGRRGCR